MIYSITFSLDGKRIASASADQTAKIWDATTGTGLMTLQGHRTMSFLLFLARTANVSSRVGRWNSQTMDSATGAELLALHADGGVYDLAFSPDGTTIVAGTGMPRADVGSIVVWESSAIAPVTGPGEC